MPTRSPPAASIRNTCVTDREQIRSTVLKALRSGDPFDALGDPNRRAIVERLKGRPQSVGEIAESLPISRPAVSRHLRLLKNAGLVVDSADGTRRLYRLHPDGAEAMREYVRSVWGQALTRYRLVAENTSTRARNPKR